MAQFQPWLVFIFQFKNKIRAHPDFNFSFGEKKLWTDNKFSLQYHNPRHNLLRIFIQQGMISNLGTSRFQFFNCKISNPDTSGVQFRIHPDLYFSIAKFQIMTHPDFNSEPNKPKLTNVSRFEIFHSKMKIWTRFSNGL